MKGVAWKGLALCLPWSSPKVCDGESRNPSFLGAAWIDWKAKMRDKT